jgi:hypothetical protein
LLYEGGCELAASGRLHDIIKVLIESTAIFKKLLQKTKHLDKQFL